MRTRAVLSWVAFCLVVGSTTHATAAPTPLDGTVSVMAQALISGSPAQFNGVTQSTDASLQPLNLNAYAEDDGTNGVAESFTEIYSTWYGPDAGYVTVGETGFQNAFSQLTNGSNSLDGTRWTYRFIAGNDGTFTLNYEVDVTPDSTDTTGLQGIRVAVIQDGYDPVADQVLAVGSSDTLTVSLIGGSTYAVSLFPLVEYSGDLGNRLTALSGYFTWEITEGQ